MYSAFRVPFAALLFLSTFSEAKNVPLPTADPSAFATFDALISAKLANPTSIPSLVAPPLATVTIPANPTEEELHSARAIVAAAHASQSAYNEYRLAHPRFNTYQSRESSNVAKSKKARRENEVPQPEFSSDIVAAIQLAGYADAKAMASNGTLINSYNHTGTVPSGGHTTFQSNHSHEKRADFDFWMTDMPHMGTQPFGNDSSYKVWRDVKKDYGAIGDGVADDTEAINLAIADGGRCGFGCNSSSVKGALVFFPPGTYRVTAPIIMFYNTQIVGYIDPATGNLPTITAATTFTGLGVLSSDVYLPGGQSEWYINQSNFYRQIRNLNIDISQATLYNVAGIHWQVAQATSIQNVKIFMSDPSTSSQVGIWAENGSGGWLDGILFYQGLYGFLGGNQQYTAGNLLFYGCKNGIGLIWDWSWTWAELIFTNCGTAINLDPPGASLSDPVGSIYLMDVQFNSCGTCIYTFPFTSSEKGTTVFTFDNVNFVTNTHFMSLTNGNYLETIDVTHNTFVQFTTIGDLIGPFGEFDGTFNVSTPKRPSILTQNAAGSSFTFAQNAYYKRGKPSYSTFGIANFFNVKEAGAYGDGVHDDTTILQQMLLYCAANNYIAFFPAGSYMISSTIVIPKGSYIVGEVWSQLVAYGSDFADENNQAAMIQVGNVGDVGNIEIQDLLFTSVGQLPGLILVSWWASAAVQGSVGMWDCHFRVGGAKGTNLQVAQCPSRTAEVIASCVAASTMMVVAPNSNGYFENVWAWVADHDLDDPANTQINIWVGRGILIQSDGPSWFWGTASEHSVIYQYNIYNASNIFMSMIQTESPYFQGDAGTSGEHQAPFPFEISGSGEDPVFDMCGYLTTSCNVAWAIVIQGSQNIFINGAGLYSWFQNYDESCVHTSNCQQRLINIVNTANLWFNHIVTIGSVEVVTPAIANQFNTIIYASDVTQALEYPWWTAIATYLDSTPSPAVEAPIKTGFVAFGESYSSGIGAGQPWDGVEIHCARGTGAYPLIFNDTYTRVWFPPNPIEIQFWACSGERADTIVNNQINAPAKWDPSKSDIALVSILGNDAGFAAILKECIIGYEKQTTCNKTLEFAELFVNATTLDIDNRFNNIMEQLTIKAQGAGKERFMVYWTGYPQFFDTTDTTCDTNYFYALYHYYNGEFLTVDLRTRMNKISTALNLRIETAVSNWNALLPYPQVVFVSPDAQGLYAKQEFCMPGISEPQLTEVGQNNVAFFYPNGYDHLLPGYTLPPPMPGAPKSWDMPLTYNSATDCVLQTDALGNSDYPYFWCDMAVALAADPSGIQAFETELQTVFNDFNTTATLNPDGSVTMSVPKENDYNKMFHPKSLTQYDIARMVLISLRHN